MKFLALVLGFAFAAPSAWDNFCYVRNFYFDFVYR